jgi:hypothetical protein
MQQEGRSVVRVGAIIMLTAGYVLVQITAETNADRDAHACTVFVLILRPLLPFLDVGEVCLCVN